MTYSPPLIYNLKWGVLPVLLEGDREDRQYKKLQGFLGHIISFYNHKSKRVDIATP